LIDAGSLRRPSLVLGTKETFLYVASFLNLAKQMQWPAPAQTKPGSSLFLQTIRDAVASSGVTLDEWNAAFGPEFGLLGEWPENSRFPSAIATLPVKETTKANDVLTRLTASSDDLVWTKQERNGVQYFLSQSSGELVALAPTIALSDHLLIAGTGTSIVEAAVQRSSGGHSDLEASPDFRAAEHAVPVAEQAFFYIDTALLYGRLDAALRPLLLLGAALTPSLTENFDLSKWPAPEVVTRHLSPIVMSQNYVTDGYVTESIGPVTLYQGVVASIGSAAAILISRPQNHRSGITPWKNTAFPTPRPGSSPSVAASATPAKRP
jgi:hypothetical protein